MLTERQEKILNTIVKEYIEKAFPISSQLLEREYDFGISPATIRAEMKRLTEKGFLYKPHISAGRIPTDKGYRFFVDSLFEEILNKEDRKVIEEIEKEIRKTKDLIKFVRNLTAFLASYSSNLVLTYLKKNEILWKEGWEKIFREPEFKNLEIISRFTKDIEKLEKNIKEICFLLDSDSEIEIFIGKENPLRGFNHFSLLSSKFSLPFEEESYFLLFGPKRMNYTKNIILLNSLKKALIKL